MLSQSNAPTQMNPAHSTSSSQKRKTVMLLEESLLNKDWEKALQEGFKEILKDTNNQNIEEKFDYIPVTTPFAGLVQWVKIVPDKKDINDYQYTEMQGFLESPAVVIVQNEDFCNKVLLSQDGIEFDAISEYVNKITSRLKPFYPKDKTIKLIFALVDIDKQILTVQKKLIKDKCNKSMQELLDQTQMHLAFNHDIEVFRCKNLNSLCEYLHTLTRVLNARVEKVVNSSFDCLMKVSKLKPDDKLSEEEKEIFELQQTWAAMLQMIPFVSKEKARAFVGNKQYSCPKRVYDAMTDTSVPESKRVALLQPEFGQNKSGVVINQAKLAKQVYRLMTVTDENELVE